MSVKLSVYTVLRPYDENKLKSPLSPRYKNILSKLDTEGFQFSPSEYIKKYKPLTNPTCTARSYRAALQTALRKGLAEGILKREVGENRVPDWFKELNSVAYWQGQLRASKFQNLQKETMTTQKTYLNHFWNFNLWLSKHSFKMQKVIPLENSTFKVNTEMIKFANVEELLLTLDNPFTKQSDVIKIIKTYLVDPIHDGKKPKSMIVVFSAIMSYFDKNDIPIRIKFDPNVKYDRQDEKEQDNLSLDEFFKMLTVGKPSITEKAVLLCKFHRGLDASTLADRFNFQALEQIQKYFKSENHQSWDLDLCPVPIKLVRIKNGYMHTGFLDRDAITAIQDYLDYVKMKNITLGRALFVNKFGEPISHRWVTGHFFSLLNESKIQKDVGSHEVRDLLKSTQIDCKCRRDVADHIIGHMPKDSYEKQAELYPETLRKEYAKGSHKINVFTKFSNVMSGSDDAEELQLKLNKEIQRSTSMEKDIEEIKQQQSDENARRDQALEYLMKKEQEREQRN